MHEADQPNLVGDLSDAHHLATEHGADVDFASTKADAAAASNPCGSIMVGVFEFGWTSGPVAAEDLVARNARNAELAAQR